MPTPINSGTFSVQTVLASLADADLSPAALRRTWNDQVLPYTVLRLVREICFEHPALQESHRACREHWEAIIARGEDPYTTFYCLSTPNHCHGQLFKVVDYQTSEVFYFRPDAPEIERFKGRGHWEDCDTEWWGQFVSDQISGEIVKGKCPRCGKEYDAPIMQEHNWWQALTTIVAGETRALRNFASTLSADWTQRLSKVIEAGKLFAYEWAPGLQGYLNRADALRNYLREAGLEDGDGEHAEFPKDLYDLVNWTVIAPDGFAFLGWPDWEAKTESWGARKRRDHVPVLWEAIRDKCAGKPAPAPIADIMDDPTPSSKAEKIKKIRDRLHNTPPPTPYRLTYFMFVGGPVRCAVVPLPNERAESEFYLKDLDRIDAPFGLVSTALEADDA